MMKHFKYYIFIPALFLLSCTSERNESVDIDAFARKLEISIKNKDWKDVSDLSLNIEEAKSLDAAIIFAPSNGDLLKYSFLTLKKAEKAWPDMPKFIKPDIDNINDSSFVLRFTWSYPQKLGDATLEQFYLLKKVRSKYFIVFQTS